MARSLDGAKRDDWRRRLVKFDSSGLMASVYERGVSALRLEEQELVLRRLNAQRREKRKTQFTRPREPKEGLLDMAERQALRKVS